MTTWTLTAIHFQINCKITTMQLMTIYCDRVLFRYISSLLQSSISVLYMSGNDNLILNDFRCSIAMATNASPAAHVQMFLKERNKELGFHAIVQVL